MLWTFSPPPNISDNDKHCRESNCSEQRSYRQILNDGKACRTRLKMFSLNITNGPASTLLLFLMGHLFGRMKPCFQLRSQSKSTEALGQWWVFLAGPVWQLSYQSHFVFPNLKLVQSPKADVQGRHNWEYYLSPHPRTRTTIFPHEHTVTWAHFIRLCLYI